jgi:hypothetical protein
MAATAQDVIAPEPIGGSGEALEPSWAAKCA